MKRAFPALVGLFLVVSPGYSQAPASAIALDTNTLALWHFDEGVGEQLRDATPFHHDGAIYHGTWVPGKFGSGLRFDGMTTYVVLPTTPELKPTHAFTLEAWVSLDTLYFPQPDFNVYDPVFLSTLGHYPYGGGYQLDITNAGFVFDVRVGTPVSRFSHHTPIPEAHKFYHLAATYERVPADPSPLTIMKTYLNGVLTDSVVYAEAIQYYDTPVLFLGTNIDGAALGTPYRREFPGVMDEVRISKIAKTAEQLNARTLLASAHDVDFGLVKRGNSPERLFEISNASFTQSLHVDSISGASAAFSFSSAPFDVAPLENHQFTVTYTPTPAAADSCTITFHASNAENHEVSVMLHGRGYALGEAAIVSGIADIPFDQGKQVRIRWYPSKYDAPGESLRVAEYGIWRRVDAPPPGIQVMRKGGFSFFSAGGHQYAVLGGELWDFISTVPAVQFEEYSYVAPTLYNSTPYAVYWSVFRVSAHTADGKFFFSEPDSGTSTDDIPPLPPDFLHAEISNGSVMLSWPVVDDPTLKEYAVYRSMSPLTLRSSGARIGTSRGTSYTDNTVANFQMYYYAVTAIDNAQNESRQAALATAFFVVGAYESEVVPHEYQLAQNYPNPFNPSTLIRYGLPEQSRVRLLIFNTLGQNLGAVVDEVQDAGYHQTTWSGAVASGIYFYRLEATSITTPEKSFMSIRKMIVVR